MFNVKDYGGSGDWFGSEKVSQILEWGSYYR